MSHRKRTTIGGYKRQRPLEFSLVQLRVLKKGLLFFAESLQRSKLNSPNLTLARLSYVTVLNKLERMLSDDTAVAFDYNELVIIAACLDMVVIDASFMAEPVDFQIAIQLNEKVKARIAHAPRVEAVQ